MCGSHLRVSAQSAWYCHVSAVWRSADMDGLTTRLRVSRPHVLCLLHVRLEALGSGWYLATASLSRAVDNLRERDCVVLRKAVAACGLPPAGGTGAGAGGPAAGDAPGRGGAAGNSSSSGAGGTQEGGQQGGGAAPGGGSRDGGLPPRSRQKLTPPPPRQAGASGSAAWHEVVAIVRQAQDYRLGLHLHPACAAHVDEEGATCNQVSAPFATCPLYELRPTLLSRVKGGQKMGLQCCCCWWWCFDCLLDKRTRRKQQQQQQQPVDMMGFFAKRPLILHKPVFLYSHFSLWLPTCCGCCRRRRCCTRCGTTAAAGRWSSRAT